MQISFNQVKHKIQTSMVTSVKSYQSSVLSDRQSFALTFGANIPYEAYKANAVSMIKKQEIPDLSLLKDWLKKESVPIDSLVDYIVEKGVLLGEGTENTVYSFPNSDLFALRIPKVGVTGKNFKEIKDCFPDLNIGQAFASVGNCGILKRQQGVAAGVPAEDRLTLPGYENAFTYLKHLNRLSQMPQEAYDDFAKLLKRLNDSDLTFDMYNPNNILVDVKNKKFNIVDDLRAIVDDKDKDSFASIAIPLFDTWYVGTLARVDDYVEVWQDVIKKSKVAATKAGLQPPKKNLFWVKKMHELADLKSYKEGS